MSASAQARAPRISADYLFHPGNVALTISGGGAAFTDFQQDPMSMSAGQGTTLDVMRRISARTAGTASAGLAVWVSKTLAVQLSGTYTPTEFRVVNQGPVMSMGFADTTEYARLGITDLSANVLLRPPVSFGRFAPYAIIGAGVLRYDVTGDAAKVPFEARPAFESGSRTQPMVVLGVGGVIPLQRKHLLLAFDLTDHLTRTPLSDGAQNGAQTGAETGAQTSRNVASDGISLTSNMRLTVGVTIPLRLPPQQP